MRRLLPLLALAFALAGVGAPLSYALEGTEPVRPNAAVTSSGGSPALTTAALNAAKSGEFIPHYQGTAFYLTNADTLNGVSRPAGWNLTRAELNWLQGNNPSNWGNAVTTIRPDGATYSTAQQGVNSTVSKIRRRGGLVPSLRDRFGGSSPSSRIALKSSLLVFASAVAPIVGNAIYEELTGSQLGDTNPEPSTGGYEFNCSQTYCSTKVYGWKHFEEGDVLVAVSDDGAGTASGTAPLAPETGWYSQVYMHSSNLTATVPSPVTVQHARAYDATDITDLEEQHHAGDAWAIATPAAQWVTVADGGNLWWSRFMTEGQMEDAVDAAPITENEYNTYSGDTYNYPSYTATPNAVGAATGLGEAGSQTTVQKDTEISIAVHVAPGLDPTTGAAPGTSPENPTYIEPAPTTVPGAPALDFSPISDIDFGCKFPYGFLTCYAIGFTELFEVEEDAPVFSFTLGWIGTVNGQEEGGEAPYVVDLEVLDDYMALWRTILSVCLWVGAIYFVATRFLGFKAGGDPGEAIEDVL